MESESKSAYTRIDKPEASTCAKIIRGFNLLAAYPSTNLEDLLSHLALWDSSL